ncbi:flagellar motor switch protein FliN [uncultured Pseudacidovorax sp.]|uniref:flagellar motor switch protein FliN n=1 Tax=uncultured Pseudacidovorax sp. TaxID=679313 RepID=UPI0025D1B6B9|nr:flagellar motor switch protein FliN [uncultured Pseudacidovorax sp.]
MSNDTSSSSAAWAEPLEPGEPGGAAAAPDAAAMAQDIQRVLDIPVQLSVELGRKKVPIKQVLQMGQGTIVELDTLAGEPMDVLVNGYLVAQGEVVVVNNRFGIRLTDVVTPSERLRRVHRA